MLKRGLIQVFFILLAATGFTQINLIPNPSFEVQDTCPNALGQMSRCQSWSSFSQSPDYYNTCSAPSCMAPPYTCEGYQKPVYGNSYAGVIAWDYSSVNYREIIGAQLTSSLSIGTKYYFSFFVNFAGTTALTMATDKMGLRFSSVPYSAANPTPINNFANFYSTNIITDSANWVQLKGSFVADSVYKYIAIGNFFDDSQTDTLSTGSFNDQSYYFIDNVCLSTDSNVAYTNKISTYNYYQNVSMFPNPCNNVLDIKCIDFPKDIELFDMMGRIQLKITNTLRNSNFILDVSALNNGIYFLKINYQTESVQKQVIISK